MDDEDKRRAYDAQVTALERGAAGAPVGWENPDSGRRGTIVPGPQYDRRGSRCRDYHPHHLYRRPSAGRARRCLPQSGWNLAPGLRRDAALPMTHLTGS